MDLPDILYTKKPPVAWISFNNPATKNTFTVPMIDSHYKALKDANDDSEIKVIVLKAEGDSFSAGGNIRDMHEGRLASWGMKKYLCEHVQKIPLLLTEVDKPVIASIDGPAFGGGFDVALACDLRIISTRACFCSTFAHLGLIPGDGGAYFLPRLLGVSKALDILLTGRVIESEEALAIGLANRMVKNEELYLETEKYAMAIARWPIESIKSIKRAVYNGLNSDLRGHLDYVSSQLALLTLTDEHREAVKRFVNKI